MQACQNIFIAQCDANANARKQSCQHKRMARVLHNQRRTKISIPALATPAGTRINNTRINGGNHAIARINNPLAGQKPTEMGAGAMAGEMRQTKIADCQPDTPHSCRWQSTRAG